MMDGDGDTSVHSNSSDVALIRGFKFQSSSEASQEKCDNGRRGRKYDVEAQGSQKQEGCKVGIVTLWDALYLCICYYYSYS